MYLLPNFSSGVAQTHRRLPIACIRTAVGLLLLIIALAEVACSKHQPAAAPPPTATPASSPAENPALVEAERKYLRALEARSSIEKQQLLNAAAAAHLPEAEAELAVMAEDAGEQEKLAIQALSDGLTERAHAGKASAQFSLARLYENGVGLPKDLEKAKALSERAAEQGLRIQTVAPEKSPEEEATVASQTHVATPAPQPTADTSAEAERDSDTQSPSNTAPQFEGKRFLAQDQLEVRSLPGEKFPETRTRLMTESEAGEMSYAKLRYAINEMYARYGADFANRPELRRQFEKFSWYRPQSGLSWNEIEAKFSEIERANQELLAKHRDAKKP